MRKLLRNFLNGLAFGITETVPGVSGGTIAVMLGFYHELIDAVSHFTKDVRKHLAFLIPLLLGAASGIVAFSSLIHYLLTNYSFPTMAFFIGLIVGIIPVIYKRVKTPGKWFAPMELLMVVAPMLLLTVSSHIKEPSAVNPAEAIGEIGIPFMFFIVFAGILAAAALILPGVSGSFILLLLGIYPLVTYSLSSVRHLSANLLPDICKVLIPLGIGIVIGGLSMARLIGRLLKSHNKAVFLIILGLLIGSVYAFTREPILFQSGLPAGMTAIGVVTFLSGSVLSFIIGKKRL